MITRLRSLLVLCAGSLTALAARAALGQEAETVEAVGVVEAAETVGVVEAVETVGVVEAVEAVAVSGLNSGDVAWVLTSSAIVLMMTIPGLALFYGGLVRPKNVLSVLMHCFTAAAVVSVIWVLWGYSLAFGPDLGGRGSWGTSASSAYWVSVTWRGPTKTSRSRRSWSSSSCSRSSLRRSSSARLPSG